MSRNCHHYNPYPRRSARVPIGLPSPPALSPETRVVIQQAAIDLQFYIEAGVIVTWNHALSQWDLVDRPQRRTTSSDRETYVGAGSFSSVPGFKYPFCPHLDVFGRPYDRMKLFLAKRYQGKNEDFFRAHDHQCDFIVIIPKVRPSVYSIGNEQEPGSDEEEDEVQQTLLASTSSPSSSQTASQNPRISPPSPATSSRPKPTPKIPGSPTTHRSYFSATVATARARSDVFVMEICWDGVFTGRFQDTPSAHPLYPQLGAVTHLVMQPYDPAYNPGCLDRTYQHLHFFDSKIGRCIRALNSTLGVTSDVVQGLIDDSKRCPSCSCQYSFEGYNAHIRDGLCGNTPNPTPVTPAAPHAPYHGLDNRELPAGKCLGRYAEFLDTPIGASMLEWNSKLGIPTDVWALVATAVEECETCHFVRTFPAHAAHLHSETGKCNDLVDDGGE
ncbi:hypothetical protein R3P38DRAFT_3242259 [Favolaschia claudopus]|uniref:Uncharacterized protein n=1 Tax=Favolaschia claudopus TaxID=2862362 RepID=A0AAV9Z4K4_9AGAR